MMLALYATWLVALLPLVCSVPHNVTVDDTDPSVTWVGNWSRTLPGFGKAFNGTYATAKNDSNAYAEFKFTGEFISSEYIGVAVYFAAPRWPYEASTRITLDPETPGAKPLLLSLVDYSASSKGEDFGQAMVLASATGLEYKEHTVRVDVGENATYSVFDAFIYTALEPSDAASAPSPTSSSPAAFTAIPEASIEPLSVSATSAAPAPASAAKKNVNLGVIFGPICAVVALVVATAGYFLYCFKKRSRRSTDFSKKTTDFEKSDGKIEEGRDSSTYEVKFPKQSD